MSTILQITDTHIVGDGALVSRRLETSSALTHLIERIVSIRHQIGVIDAVLVTGDLSDDGSKVSYEKFKDLLAPLDLPLLVIPGNHDVREPMRAAFVTQFTSNGPLNWVNQVGDLTIIGLDTLVEGTGKGTLSTQTLDFLETTLANAHNKPILLAMHHPPFLSGINFMDNIGLTNRDAFCDIVSCHIGPMRIVCGHIHSMMITDVGGHTAISAPSPCSTFNYDIRDCAPIGFMVQEDGCLLHKWSTVFQTIRIGPGIGTGPFQF
ncbi:MAG: phosphodiesterase [Octadecabacter sp.]|nr:phosphodiesterase [Octadecabacter sp.]